MKRKATSPEDSPVLKKQRINDEEVRGGPWAIQMIISNNLLKYLGAIFC